MSSEITHPKRVVPFRHLVLEADEDIHGEVGNLRVTLDPSPFQDENLGLDSRLAAFMAIAITYFSGKPEYEHLFNAILEQTEKEIERRSRQ